MHAERLDPRRPPRPARPAGPRGARRARARRGPRPQLLARGRPAADPAGGAGAGAGARLRARAPRADPAGRRVPEDGFRFQHALIREAVYEAMPKALRADLHETVAARLDDAGARAGRRRLPPRARLPAARGARPARRRPRAGAPAASCASPPRRRSSRTDASGDDLAPRAGARASPRRRSRAARRADRPRRRAARTEATFPAPSPRSSRRSRPPSTLGLRAAELHARIELQFVRAFAEGTPVEESVALATEAIAELEPLGDELALARAWWLRSSGDLAACRWRARAEAIERALEHARRAQAGSRDGRDARRACSRRRSSTGRPRSRRPSPASRACPTSSGSTRRCGARSTRASPGCSRCAATSTEARRLFRDAAATYEEFGLRFRRATQSFVGAQIELLAGDADRGRA